MVLQRTPVYSALSLIVVLCSLAGVYLLLEAEFLAVIQVIVYAGAIMVLFVFVIMLLNAGHEAPSHRSHVAKWLGAPLIGAFLAEMMMVIWDQFPPAPERRRRRRMEVRRRLATCCSKLCAAVRGNLHPDSGRSARCGSFSEKRILAMAAVYDRRLEFVHL